MSVSTVQEEQFETARLHAIASSHTNKAEQCTQSLITGTQMVQMFSVQIVQDLEIKRDLIQQK